MISQKTFHRGMRGVALPVLGLGLGVGLIASRASADDLLDVNGATPGSGGTNGSTYTWETPIWTADTTGSTATTNYVEGLFVRFSAGTDVTGDYTVNMNADHHCVGMFFEADG